MIRMPENKIVFEGPIGGKIKKKDTLESEERTPRRRRDGTPQKQLGRHGFRQRKVEGNEWTGIFMYVGEGYYSFTHFQESSILVCS